MTSAINRSARVGLVTDQTGALSFMGIANVNVAKMVIDDINASGGLLGRPVELFVEDSATDDERGGSRRGRSSSSGRRRRRRRWHLQLHPAGHQGTGRRRRREKLYLYPEQYEGQECHPLIFCTGPVPAQQIDPFFPWLMQETGAQDLLPAVGRLHLAAHAEQEGARGRGRQRRRDRRRGVLPARSHRLRREIVADIMASGAEVVFNTIVPPGLTPFLEQLHRAGFTRARRARSSAPTSTRTS